MRKTETTNPELLQIIRFLTKQSKKEDVKIWRDVANNLVKPNRRRITVNLSRLNRHTEKNETVLIPGKVLGSGKIDHPVNVAAFQFSHTAKQKIESAKGKTLTLLQLVKKNPKGSRIKVLG